MDKLKYRSVCVCVCAFECLRKSGRIGGRRRQGKRESWSHSSVLVTLYFAHSADELEQEREV